MHSTYSRSYGYKRAEGVERPHVEEQVSWMLVREGRCEDGPPAAFFPVLERDCEIFAKGGLQAGVGSGCGVVPEAEDADVEADHGADYAARCVEGVGREGAGSVRGKGTEEELVGHVVLGHGRKGLPEARFLRHCRSMPKF